MQRRIVGLLLGLSALLPVLEAWGAVRYVSKSGMDSNNVACVQAVPCRTIQNAVDSASAGDTISIGVGKFAEYFGVTIDKNLTLNGAGIFSTRVSGAWSGFSIFRIESGAVVTITDLDVMNGHAEAGGGIWNQGTLTVERVRVRKNSAEAGGGVFNWADGKLFMFNSEIAMNSASHSGGGLHNQGYAELSEVQIVANHSDDGSGGITNVEWAEAPASFEFNLIARRSLVSRNRGDGIVNFGSMSLINTTVSGNSEVGIRTGGGGYTSLTHVTVAENGKGPDQFPGASKGGLQGQVGSELELVNTIVANNTPVQCVFPPSYALSSINSLDSDQTCKMFPGGNLPGIDPNLGPLTWSKFGLTRIHALKHGSPAIDAVPVGFCAPTDQRGVLRPIDGDGVDGAACDIGAFEYAPLKRILEQ